MNTMKVLMLTVLIALSITGCVETDNPIIAEVTDTKPFNGDRDIDESVRPGDDYYRYAVGSWLKDENRDENMAEEVDKKLTDVYKNVLLNASDPVINHIRTLAEQAITDDSQLRESMKQLLAYIDGIRTPDERNAVFFTLHQMGLSPMFSITPLPASGVFYVLLTNGGKYRKMRQRMEANDTEGITKLVKDIAGSLSTMGFSDERIQEITAHALEVELMEATINIKTDDAMRGTLSIKSIGKTRSAGMYEVFQLLSLMDKQIDLNFLPAPNEMTPLYGEGNRLTDLIDLYFSEAPEDIAKVRDYLIYNTFSQNIALMPSIDNTSLYDVMWNATDALKYYMYKTCVNSFGIENIYKDDCQRIMEDMRQLFAERMAESSWMSELTKEYALKKLQAIKFNIGYPDVWNDDFLPEVMGDNLLDAVNYLRRFQEENMQKLIGKNAQEYGWEFFTSSTPFYLNNSFYNPTTNMLIILPAYLTEERFSMSESEAKKYASSYVFGHEISHGFDSNGSKYDANGIFTDWWTPEDKKAFEEKQQKMIELFSQLEIYKGLHVDGAKSLTENMADLGGTTLALELYKRRLQKQGYSQTGMDEQIKKFFLSYAQIWKSTDVDNKDNLDRHYNMQNEPHADNHIRINGIVRLMDDWYRIYDVQPGDSLYVAPEDRVKIW